MYRCELLSKIIIFVTRHNNYYLHRTSNLVVNCFQKLLSSWHDTTYCFSASYNKPLWIAFKNYYLRDTTQLRFSKKHTKLRCELLSKIIIFVTRHNQLIAVSKFLLVVNCFQKLLSSWHDTTKHYQWFLWLELWIAFKNYYLRDTTQRLKPENTNATRCELLSKIIIFVTRHN